MKALFAGLLSQGRYREGRFKKGIGSGDFASLS